VPGESAAAVLECAPESPPAVVPRDLSPSSRAEPAPGTPAGAPACWMRQAVVTMALITSLFLLIASIAARGDLWRGLAQIPLQAVGAMTGLVALGLAIRMLRWHYYVRRAGWNVPWLAQGLSFLASFALTATPGKVGEIVKSVLLQQRYNVPLAAGFGVLVAERLGDLFAVMLLAVGGLALLPAGIYGFVTAALGAAAVMVFVCFPAVHRPVLERMSRAPLLSKVSAKGFEVLAQARSLLRPASLVAGTGMAVVAWGCEALAFHLLIRGVGMESPVLTSFSIYGLATLAGALSGLPGGLGGMESVMILLLTQVGGAPSTATMVVAVFRLSTLGLGSVVGLVCLVAWQLLIAGQPTAASSGASRPFPGAGHGELSAN